MPMSGVALSSRSIKTVPKNPVPPVMKIFFPAKKLAIVGRSSLTSLQISLALLISSIIFSSFDPLNDFLFIFQIFRARDLIRLYRSTLCKELANVAAYNCCRFLLSCFAGGSAFLRVSFLCARMQPTQTIVNFIIYRVDVHDTEFFCYYELCTGSDKENLDCGFYS